MDYFKNLNKENLVEKSMKKYMKIDLPFNTFFQIKLILAKTCNFPFLLLYFHGNCFMYVENKDLFKIL
jgi:hypothetical protein